MKYFYKILFLITIQFGFHECKSTHVMGADIEYTFRDKDTLDIVVSIYRDCKNISVTPIQMDLIGIGCNYSSSYNMTQKSCQDITPVCKKSCSKCDRSNCNAYGYPNGANAACTFPYGIERITFTQKIIFKNTNCCKFRIEVSLCCRNGAITTCCAGDNIYAFAEVNRCLSKPNSSPKLVNDPAGIVCVGNCTSFNVGAVDTVDGDYITYHLRPALSAYNYSCTYQGSYTYGYPFYYDGFPNIKQYNPINCKGIKLDSVTGDFMFKPMQQQIAQYVIEMREWRKDSNCNFQMIGRTMRDMSLIVVANCVNKPPSIADSIVYTHAGNKVCLDSIPSTDPDTKDTVILTWNEGIPKGFFATGYKYNSSKQYFNFCWQTDTSDYKETPYIFTVTAKDNACPLVGRYTKSFSINVNKKLDSSLFGHTITKIKCGGILLQANYNASYPCNINYQWVVDSMYYSGATVIVNNLADGMHIVKLKIPSINYNKYTYIDTIYNVGNLKINLGKDSINCYGNPIVFKAKTIGGVPPLHYKWSTGSPADTLDSIWLNGTYTTQLTCKVTDSTGCMVSDDVITTAVFNPTINLGADQRECSGNKITFTAPANLVQYSWKDLNTNTIISYNNSIVTDSTLKVVCYITDKNGCVGKDTVSANFNPAVKIDAGPDLVVCSDDTIHIIAKGNGIKEWTYNSSKTYTGDTLTFIPDSKTVWIKATEVLYNLACEDTDEVYITVNPRPNFLLGDTFTVCKKFSAYIQAQGSAQYKYLWSTGDTGQNLYASAPGEYSLTATNMYNCNTTKFTHLLNFTEPVFNLQLSNDTLYANSNQQFNKYSWYLDSQFYATTFINRLYISQWGSYVVKVTDSHGCIAASPIYTIASVGEVNTLSGFKIYPNPSIGIYYIESNNPLNDLTIYDLMGRKVYNSSSTKNIIDLSEQPEGIYLLQLNRSIWYKLSKL